MRMVFFTLISRMSRQFIHRKANCMNSTFCASRCAANGAASPGVSTLHLNDDCARDHTINTGDELRHAPDAPVDARLLMNVVVLYAIEEAREAPEGVCFDRVEDVLR